MYVLCLAFSHALSARVRASRTHKTISSVFILAVILLCSIPDTAPAVTIGLTRFGLCFPATECNITIIDNDPVLDLDPAVGVIQYSTTVGQAPGGTYLASGTATETSTPGGGVFMTLTDATVQGTGGGIGPQPVIPGQIALISMAVISSLGGVSGSAGLVGEYQSFPNTMGGMIGFADVLLQGRVGGALIGLVDPPPAIGATSPQPFAGFNARTFPLPVNNVLIGTLDFQVQGGDGFFLPMSMEVLATPIPEPSTLASLGLGLIGIVVLRRRRRRKALPERDGHLVAPQVPLVGVRVI